MVRLIKGLFLIFAGFTALSNKQYGVACVAFGIAALYIWSAVYGVLKTGKKDIADSKHINNRVSIMQRLRNVHTLSEEEKIQLYNEIYALPTEEFIYLKESLRKCSWYVYDPMIELRANYSDID